MMSEPLHQPVMLSECLAALRIDANGVYIDGTFGRGGHSRAILEQLGKDGKLLAFDKDPDAIATGDELAANDQRFQIHHGSFAALASVVNELGWQGKVNGILLDLGVSSPQLDNAERGFSFRESGPLDMRMDTTHGLTAAEWIATAREQDIARVLKEFGEERFAKRIAGAIVRERAQAPINTTQRLSTIVAAANPSWEPGKDPATRSFQAIRIFINSELEDLRHCLQQALEVLAPEGRLVVISFHSLEDRIVKRFMREQARGDDFPPDLPVTHMQLNPQLIKVGKAQRPGQAEVQRNPRARSATLRVAERMR